MEKKEVEFVRVGSCQNELSKSSIDQSWSRCIQNAMISSDMPNASKVSSQRFSHMLEDNRDILKTAHPYIKMLSATATKCGVLIGLSNEEGVILYIEGNSPQLRELGYERAISTKRLIWGQMLLGYASKQEINNYQARRTFFGDFKKLGWVCSTHI